MVFCRANPIAFLGRTYESDAVQVAVLVVPERASDNGFI